MRPVVNLCRLVCHVPPEGSRVPCADAAYDATRLRQTCGLRPLVASSSINAAIE
jgi:hypothetical protein